MKVTSNSVRNALAAAALVIICSAQISLAGYQNMMNPTNSPTGPAFVGSASASLGYTLTATNAATTPNNVKFNPSAAVGTNGTTWTAVANAPGKSPAGATSQIYVNTALPGGPKVVVYSATPSGAGGLGSADPSPDLASRLTQDGFVLTPYPCGAGYNVASGNEVINGQNFLVVLGTSTGGTAHWFRGYFFNGTGPTNRDQVIAEGTKLYDVVVTGPFDFGDPNSIDRCNALKIPINYTGPDLYLISDGTAISTTTLQIVNCPGTVTLAACNPSYPTNSFTTSGGCGAVTVTFDTDPNSIAPGTSATVTATATDAAGNNSTNTCQFTAIRPAFLIVGAPTTTFPLSACSPSYPLLTTSGGCLPIGNIVFNPASASSIAPGTVAATVTATVTDANGTVATTNFMVSRPALQIVGCPTGPLDFSACGSPVAYPSLTAIGGCNPVITFSPAVTALVPGSNNVIATAKDANGSVATPCQFEVIRPYLSLGSSGYEPPIGGVGGSCTTPLRVNNSGNNLKIAFSTTLCGTPYNSGTAPKITITQLDPNSCKPTKVIVNRQTVALINNQWHFNWSTGGNLGYFQISVDLGDGNPDPLSLTNPLYAIVLMQ